MIWYKIDEDGLTVVPVGVKKENMITLVLENGARVDKWSSRGRYYRSRAEAISHVRESARRGVIVAEDALYDAMRRLEHVDKMYEEEHSDDDTGRGTES